MRRSSRETAIRIRRTIEKVPGGMMVVPLTCGAIVTTFAPGTANFFGSFTGALFTGAIPLIAVFFVCLGSTISFRSLPKMVRRGGALLAVKVGLGIAAGFILGHAIGYLPIPGGWLAGVSTLAVVTAFNDTNGGLYMALMEYFGRAEDAGAYCIMAIESGPFFTMITLGVAGLASFPWQTIVGAILPLFLGVALGNLDPEMQELLGKAAPATVPFFAFALGSGLNLKRIWGAGLVGFLLGIAVIAISGIFLVVADRLTGGTGVAGLAASTTAGNAAAVPMLVAAADHKYDAAAGPATALVASSVVVTAFLAPFITAWWDRRTRAKRPAGEGEGQAV
ncbi:MAG: 2-keto-3-deoxygluconate permease [Terracidiphilus sp.]